MAEFIDYVYDADENDLSGELLPCEFCSELFPEDILTLHQTGCKPELFIASTHKEDSFVTPGKTKLDLIVPNFSHVFEKEIQNIKKERKVNIPVSLIEYSPSPKTDDDDGRKKHKIVDSTKNFTVIPPGKLHTIGDEISSLKEKVVTLTISDLSDDDNEDGETIESFHRQASIILQQRLATLNKGNQTKKKDTFHI